MAETHTPLDQDASTAQLMRRLSDQMTTLVHQEIELAKAEVSEKGKHAGIGAGMFGGAGAFGFYAFGALIATVILLLAQSMDAWVGAAIVTVVLALVAGVLALSGKRQIDQATPPAPEQAIESVKQDAETIKGRAQAGRN